MSNFPPQGSLRQLQDFVAEVEIELGFQNTTVAQKCLLLAEEVGELIKSLRKSHLGMRLGSPGYVPDPEAELADVLFVALGIANRLNIDLEQALVKKAALAAERS